MSDLDHCPVAATLGVIAGKWTPLILLHLRDRPRRFNALRRLLPDVTQRMLTLQLRALERHGVVSRTVFETVPPKVEYRLTERGLTLAPIIEAMEAWGSEHVAGSADTPASEALSADVDAGSAQASAPSRQASHGHRSRGAP